jgi:hypothetical protein
MPRQRLGLPSGVLTTIGQKLMLLVGLALIWGGAVVALLAAGVAPADVQGVTGYRTVYDELAAVGPATWDDTTAIVIAVAGVVLFVALLALGWAQRITPHLARTDLVLTDDDLGVVTVDPRAIERAAEIAAGRGAAVHAVRARLGEDGMSITIHARGAAEIPDTLRGAQQRVRAALQDAGTPQQTVRVVVTRFTAPSTRELR